MTATTNPPPPSANALSFASIVPSIAAYTHIGCYQETANDTAANDVRALACGTMVRNCSLTRLDLANVSLFQHTSNSMTVATVSLSVETPNTLVSSLEKNVGVHQPSIHSR